MATKTLLREQPDDAPQGLEVRQHARWRTRRGDSLCRNPWYACGARAVTVNQSCLWRMAAACSTSATGTAVRVHHAVKTAPGSMRRRGQSYRPKVGVDPQTGVPLAGEDHWSAE